LGEPAASRPVVEVSDGTARLRNGDSCRSGCQPRWRVPAISAPGALFPASDGRELLSEQSPHFTSPPSAAIPKRRRYLRLRGHVQPFPRGAHLRARPAPARLFDQKGAIIDLIQRNTEVCIPFALSNRGYGFLWNMPGVGRVELGANRTRWVADDARQLDYWVTTAPTPARSLASTPKPPACAHAAGLGVRLLAVQAPLPPPGELLEVAREHKRRACPCR